MTGNDAAAKRDVLTAITARFPPARIVVAETYVQGPRAAPRDRRGAAAPLRPGVDVVVLARGGGSFEDLLPFSDERVVRAVAACPVPGRLGGRARAGHAAVRPRRGRPRLDADRGGAARRPRPARSCSRGSSARGRRSDAARAGPRAAAAAARRARTSDCAARRRWLVERRRARLEHTARAACARSRRGRRSSAATRSCAPGTASSARRDARRPATGSTSSWPRAASRERCGRGDDEPTFEEAQRELEQIVERLERGNASLDEAVALWERGEELYRFCAAKLDTAEGKVEELAGASRLRPGSLVRIARHGLRRRHSSGSPSSRASTHASPRARAALQGAHVQARPTVVGEGSRRRRLLHDRRGRGDRHPRRRGAGANSARAQYFGELALIDDGHANGARSRPTATSSATA